MRLSLALVLSVFIAACDAVPTSNPPTASQNDVRPIAIQWDGYPQLIAGTLDLQQAGARGRIRTVLPGNEGTCEGTFISGAWSLTCSNGMSASGTYTAAGPGRGSTGEGVDSKGQKVAFTLGARTTTAQQSAAALPLVPAVPSGPTTVAATSPMPGSLGKHEFKAPAVGTTFQFSNNRVVKVTDVEGKSLRVTNAYMYGGFFAEVGPQAGKQDYRDAVESLWPLEVGKKAAFSISGRSGDGYYSTWRQTISVVREEEIKTGAGTFPAYVLEARQTGQGNNVAESLTTYWYAPAISFPARIKYEIVRGVGTPSDLVLVRIIPATGAK